MDPTRLAPESIDGEKKRAAKQDAKDMQQAVARNCARSNTKVPPFEFIELIGKGASGRVYKCRDTTTNELVAIKIVDTDNVDYETHTLDKDDTIRDFLKEVNTLKHLKDARAKNVNLMKDAFEVSQQLWIVCEYCTGGSVRTLMRASPPSKPGLDEEYIIPIARELALAIKNVHESGVIHRDIKCTNVYVTESGEIQLGDFGIVGVLDDEGAKRKTIVGTPHYMPLEMLPTGRDTGGNQTSEAYGREVDIWSFGCTIHEMATGNPPNANTPLRSLGSSLLAKAPRLEGEQYSQELRDFVAFLLNSNPKERPTAEEVQKHPYLAGSARRYPTKNLIKLIQRYKAWEYGGGWRHSLFMAGGAPPPVPGNEDDPITASGQDADDWNFSTSDTFNADFGRRYSMMMDTRDTPDLTIDTASASNLPPIITQGLTPFEKMQKEISANRGEKSLERLWNTDTAPYELHEAVDFMGSFNDDLPLRRMTADAPTRESQIIIDLDSAGEIETGVPTLNFDFGDQPTIRKSRAPRTEVQYEDDEDDFKYDDAAEGPDKRATMEWTFPTTKKAAVEPKRATMDWKFPAKEPSEPTLADFDESLPTIGEGGKFMTVRPALKHTATMPVGQFDDYIHRQPSDMQPHSMVRDSTASLLDLNMSMVDSDDIPRPSTAISASGSTMTDATSGNPFDLEEDPAQNEADRKRFSHHKQWQSEGGQSNRCSSRRSVPMHARGNSLSSTDEEDYDRISGSDQDDFAYKYNRKLSERIGHEQLNESMDLDHVNMSTWPTYGPESGFTEVRGYTDDLDKIIAQQSLAARTIDMARPIGPSSQALQEDAPPEILDAELERLLNDMEINLAGVGEAFKVMSERITGVESGDDTEDDETF